MSHRASALLCSSIIYVGLGTISTAVGPLLPNLAVRNGARLAEMGLLFTAIFLGAVVSQLIAGPITDRTGRRPVFLFAVALLVAATVGIIESRALWLTLAFASLWGVGLGVGQLVANVLAIELFAERGVSTLNLLNVFYGLGAFAGPALVSVSLRWWHTGMPALWFGALVLASQIPYIARMREEPAIGAHAPADRRSERGAGLDPAAALLGPARSGGSERRSVYRSPFLWLLGAALLVYVGAEQMVGGWAVVYMERTASLALAKAALVASGFWIAYTLGRAASAGIGVRIAARFVLAASLATAAAGVLLVNLASGRVGLSVLGFLLTGFGFGPIYPTATAIIGRFFAGAAGKAIGTTGALGSVGGMILPFLDGLFIGRLGPAAAARFALIAVAGIAALTAIARLAAGRRSEPVATSPSG